MNIQGCPDSKVSIVTEDTPFNFEKLYHPHTELHSFSSIGPRSSCWQMRGQLAISFKHQVSDCPVSTGNAPMDDLVGTYS